MMSKDSHSEDAAATLARLRRKIGGGASLLLDSLSDAELEAMQELLFNGEAEIVGAACKPFLQARLERTIIA